MTLTDRCPIVDIDCVTDDTDRCPTVDIDCVTDDTDRYPTVEIDCVTDDTDRCPIVEIDCVTDDTDRCPTVDIDCVIDDTDTYLNNRLIYYKLIKYKIFTLSSFTVDDVWNKLQIICLNVNKLGASYDNIMCVSCLFACLIDWPSCRRGLRNAIKVGFHPLKNLNSRICLFYNFTSYLKFLK